ncbi:hypothetical protein BU15DRAFT_49796, partial [Melanogaster broomeanus]
SQSTAQTIFLPAAAASRARSLPTKPTAVRAGSGAREDRKGLDCQIMVRRSSWLLSVIGMDSASGARAISNALMAKSSFPSAFAMT